MTMCGEGTVVVMCDGDGDSGSGFTFLPAGPPGQILVGGGRRCRLVFLNRSPLGSDATMTPPGTPRLARLDPALRWVLMFTACVAGGSQAVSDSLYPAHVAPAVEEGSALDASFMLHGPAGRHGPTLSRDGNLLFADGTPARFWGVNLAWEAQYPPEDKVEGIVRRLRAHGINMVRLTYLDRPPPRGLVQSMSPAGVEIDRDQLAKLDRLAAALIDGGIYLNVTLMMGGPVSGVAPGVGLRGRGVSALQMIHPSVIAAHERFLEFLLTHTNPHTGRTWGEGPGIAIMEVYNEGDPFYLRRALRDVPPEFLAPLHEQWRAWLREEGREGAGEFDLALLDGRDEAAREAVRFFSGMQEAHGARMRALARRCGYRGALCDTAGGAYSPAARWAQRGADLQVAHYYHDHLQHGEGRSWIRNIPGCANDFRTLLVAAWERDPRRPYLVGEWDFCWPNEFRAEGVPAMAAFAAMQGWAGALQFTYWSGAWDSVEQYLGAGGRIAGIWRIMSDPAVMALYPAAAMMFLRGDVSPCHELVSPPVDAFGVRNWPPADPRAFVHRYGTTLQPEPAPPAAAEGAAPRVTVSDTGEFRHDRDGGFLVIDAPRSQAVIGMVGGQRLETRDVAFELDNPFAVVTVSSLSEAPIATSERLLITTVARAQNTDFRAETEDGRYLIRAHGRGPVMAEAVTGHVTLKGRDDVAVYVLEPTGARRGLAVTTDADGGTRIDLAASEPAMHYEVIRSPAQ